MKRTLTIGYLIWLLALVGHASALTIESPRELEHTNDFLPSFSGTGNPGDTIEVVLVVLGTESNLGTTLVQADGTWQLDSQSLLAIEGTHQVRARAIDAQGNISPFTPDRNFILDLQEPRPARITSPKNNAILTDPQIVISGTAEAEAQVDIFLSNQKIGETQVDAQGQWRFGPHFIEPGSHSLKTRVIDRAGNEGGFSFSLKITVDITILPAPIITLPKEGAFTRNTPLIVGLAKPDVTVVVFSDGIEIGEILTRAPPSFDPPTQVAWAFFHELYSEPLAEGPHVITARAKNELGQVGPFSEPIRLTVDTKPPPPPLIVIPSHEAILNINEFVLLGSAEPNSRVLLFSNVTKIAETKASAGGLWHTRLNKPLVDGPHLLSAQSIDQASNRGSVSGPTSIVVETGPPPRPAITHPKTNEFLRKDRPVVAGTVAESSATVEIFLNSEKIGETKTFVQGDWFLVPEDPLSEGRHIYQARTRDHQGHLGELSEPVPFIVDVTAPHVPTLASPVDKAPLKNPSVQTRGTAEANTFVVVWVDDERIDRTPTDSNGEWSFRIPALTHGEHRIAIHGQDHAGNKSPMTPWITVMVDTRRPNRPVILSPESGKTLEGPALIFNGTGEPNAIINIVIDATFRESGPIDSDGNWTLQTTAPLKIGPHFIVAQAQDIAGNISLFTQPVDFFVEISTQPPPAPVNQAPLVTLGENQTITFPDSLNLSAVVTDDSLPSSALSVQWSKKEGPGPVRFENPTALETKAHFSESGTFILIIEVSDGQLQTEASLTVVVQPASVELHVPDFVNVHNPVNGPLTIPFTLARAGRVTVQIYDHFGDLIRTVLDSPLSPGHHQTSWDGTNRRQSLSGSGVYLVFFKLDDQMRGIRKIISAR